MSFRYFDFNKWLSLVTAYMIVGYGAVTIFSDIAVEQRFKILVYVFHFIYLASILMVALVIVFFVIYKGNNLIENISIISTVILFSVFFLLLHPEYEEIWKHFIFTRFIKRGLILFMLVRLKPDYKLTLKYCMAISRITVVAFSLILFLSDWYTENYLAVSDNLSIAVMIVFGSAVYSGNIFDYAIGIFGIIAMVLFGDRAHIICLVFALVLWGIKNVPNNKHSKRFRAYCFIVIIAATTVFYYNSDVILSDITLFLGDLGVDSRNIQYLLSARLADSSGRSVFYGNIWKAVVENPFGYGILGDVILNYENRITPIITGAYAHNGYLQAICEFGLLAGSAIWAWIIVRAIRVYNWIIDKEQMVLFIALCGSGVFILIFSYSYWICTPFWGFLALIINNRDESGRQLEDIKNEA